MKDAKIVQEDHKEKVKEQIEFFLALTKTRAENIDGFYASFHVLKDGKIGGDGSYGQR